MRGRSLSTNVETNKRIGVRTFVYPHLAVGQVFVNHSVTEVAVSKIVYREGVEARVGEAV